MAKVKEPTNPFYVVLLAAGIVFFVTASAYFVMTLRADRLGRHSQSVSQGSALMQFMDERGGQVLAGEIVLLAVCTAAAIVSDGYWGRARRDAPAGGQRESVEP